MLASLGTSRVAGAVAGSVVAGVGGNWEGCSTVASELKAKRCKDWVGMDWASLPEGCEPARTVAARVSLEVLRLSSACVVAGGGHSTVVVVAKESAAGRVQVKAEPTKASGCRWLLLRAPPRR